MNKIHKKDKVVVITGRNKGENGVVSKVIMGDNGKPERVVVDGVNMVTHFIRPNPQKNEQGGLIKREASIHVSNVAIVDAETNLPARVKISKDENNKKIRTFHVGQRRLAK